MLFVVPIFVRHVPVGQNHDTRCQSLAPPTLFRSFDFEVDVVPVLQLLIEFPLESISPFRVVLDNLLEVIEELSVGINPGDLNVREGVADEVSLKKRNGLKTPQGRRYLVKRAVQIDHPLKEWELHDCTSLVAENGRPTMERSIARKGTKRHSEEREEVRNRLTRLNEKRRSCATSGKRIASDAAIVASLGRRLWSGVRGCS